MAEPISIIVPVFNKAAYSRRCFAALLQTAHRPLEIVVVDNGSTDDTPALLTEIEAMAGRASIGFVRIRNDSNRGASTARNQGLDTASGRFIVVMDNDVVVRRRSWADTMMAALQARPEVGIVGPKLLFAFPPHTIQFAGGAVSPSGRVEFVGRGKPDDTTELNVPRDVQCFISACWMMPRTIVDQLGGFDEAFNPVQFEDIDFSYRVRHAGYRILYLPSVEVHHFENVTTGMSPTLNSTYLIVKNGLLFKKRWHFMFSRENGPRDDQIHWAKIEKIPLDQVGELEIVD
ncbi:MAG TPA: glycosyltransferase family 2 protein [Planctomycetota bacterium]|nr:glycosyltransferase family 2 protein [Planctomycetota bacterium]